MVVREATGESFENFSTRKFQLHFNKKIPFAYYENLKKAHFNLPIIVIASQMANIPLRIQFLSILRTKWPQISIQTESPKIRQVPFISPLKISNSKMHKS